jgi:hypothetical protein
MLELYLGNISFVFLALRIVVLCLIATGASAQQVSDHPSWQLGGFAAGGFTPDYEIQGLLNYTEEDKFFSAGMAAGRMLAAAHGRGLLRGRPEAVIEVIPYWEVDEPKQTDTFYFAGSNVPLPGFSPATTSMASQ